MIKIYHNPRCTKSREGLAILNDAGVDFEIVDYLNNVPTTKELTELLKMLDIPAEKLLRKGEPVFKELYKGKNLTEKEWIAAMVAHPKLIERPIVVKDGKAVVGRPPEMIKGLL